MIIGVMGNGKVFHEAVSLSLISGKAERVATCGAGVDFQVSTDEQRKDRRFNEETGRKP